MTPKNTICLWFDTDAHEAATFYAAWLTRDGKTAALRATNADWANPRFSPDGQKLALEIFEDHERSASGRHAGRGDRGRSGQQRPGHGRVHLQFRRLPAHDRAGDPGRTCRIDDLASGL